MDNTRGYMNIIRNMDDTIGAWMTFGGKMHFITNGMNGYECDLELTRYNFKDTKCDIMLLDMTWMTLEAT